MTRAVAVILAAMVVPWAADAGQTHEGRVTEPQPLPETERVPEPDVRPEPTLEIDDAGPQLDEERRRIVSPVASRRIWQVAGGLALSLPSLVLLVATAEVAPGSLILTLPLAIAAPALAVHGIGMLWLDLDLAPGWALLGATVGIFTSLVGAVATAIASARCFSPGSICAGGLLFDAVLIGGVLLVIASPTLGALWGFEIARMRAEAGVTRRRPRSPYRALGSLRLLPAPPAVVRTETEWIGLQPLLHVAF